MIPTATIDSNVVFDVYQRRRQSAVQLLDLHPEKVVLFVASRTPDWEATRREWRDDLNERGIRPVASVFRLDMSRLDGDVLAGENNRVGQIREKLYEASAIRPGENAALDRRLTIDADIVDAHIRSGNDYLITSDRHILDAAKDLQDEHGIRVLTPETAVKLIEQEDGINK